jgi:hypothetical protein
MTDQPEPTDAVCPACNGSTRRPVDEASKPYRSVLAGYRAQDDTLPCDNCGGQTMSLRATGRTPIDAATGLGCLHDYVGREAGRCYRIFTCTKCTDSYDIDSSD